MIKYAQREEILKITVIDFCRFSVLLACFCVIGGADASQAPNPRSGIATVNAPHSDAVDSRRGNGGVVVIPSVDAVASRAAVRRGGTATTVSRAGTVKPVTSTVSRSAVNVRKAPSVSSSRGATTSARAASNSVVRSAAMTHGASVSRAGTNSSVVGVSRAGSARATTVFDDVSKMGTGYATCRDAYATCMDQLCAKANDTYRRCFCSARFAEFRDTEAALDEAKTLLMQFEDNSLNAVDKTAEEVNAMYSATVGEAAIKKDTSAAQNTLSEISELLSGKKKATTSNNSSTSLGVLSLDFTADVDDIWSGDGDSTFFGSGTTDLSQLEGVDLYNKANSQCLKIIADSCENNAVLNMAKSSYSILISQDCNAYEKKINTQREAVKNTVRQAEKYLRDARLEEYRTHNSADVNECIGKVKSAIQMDTACGAGYKRCLDYSGAYVNSVTGEAVPSPRLFELGNLILLDGTADVLGQNAQFNKFLDDKRMYAKSALDTCRDIQDIVWTEFKRSALIEIAQAQDVLIENVKSSCVSTMKECYDTQSDGLKSFDDTTAQAAGALSAYAARAMCEEKVIACASLYGDTEGCTFDGNGKIKSGNSGDGRCGLTELLKFVDVVDNVRVAEGCATAIDNYVQQLCTPTAGDMGFPWLCRKKLSGSTSEKANGNASASIAANIMQFAVDNCSDPTQSDKSYSSLPVQTRTQVEKSVADIQEQMEYQLMESCEALDGYWQDADSGSDKLLTAFYSSVYGTTTPDATALSWGRCVENSTKVQCEAYNTPDEEPVATYDKAKDECIFTNAWYEARCTMLGSGYFENGICYVKNK